MSLPPSAQLVCAEPDLVQAWPPESIAADAGVELVRPDSVVVLQTSRGPGVLWLDIDESTEHAPQIRSKLAAYERVLPSRLGWQVMFVVPSNDRLAWLRRVGRPHTAGLGGRIWAAVLADLDASRIDARVMPVSRAGEPVPFRSLLADPRPRRCPTPVGSDARVRLLGSGGEDLDGALR